MTPESAVAFAVAMLLWAALPGPGLAAVVSRALASGPRAGFAVIAGLVAADFVFLGVAVLGLSVIATAMGPMFQVVKYAGGAYLVWRGYRIFVAADAPPAAEAEAGSASWRDSGLGLLITLGNPKAILFFGALLPAFVDMTAVGFGDFLVLAGTVAGASCLVYGGYMALADRARRLLSSAKAFRRLRQASGAVLIGSGIAVATQ